MNDKIVNRIKKMLALAYNKGQEFGSKINLNRQIGGDTSPTPLGLK